MILAYAELVIQYTVFLYLYLTRVTCAFPQTLIWQGLLQMTENVSGNDHVDKMPPAAPRNRKELFRGRGEGEVTANINIPIMSGGVSLCIKRFDHEQAVAFKSHPWMLLFESGE
jgi:hypothetical protein